LNEIKMAEVIFVKYLGLIQGKTTRVHSSLVPINYVMFPPDVMQLHKEVVQTVYILIMDQSY
jgi:hypothetical protein